MSLSERSPRGRLAGLLAAAAGLILLLCLAGAAVVLFVLFQIPASPGSFLRAYQLQQSARAQPCASNAHLVPGTYQPDPVQSAGPWLVVTYTAACAWAGQPPEATAGFVANTGQGSDCQGSGSDQVIAPPGGAPGGGMLPIVVGTTSQCIGVGPNSLSIVTGQVFNPGAVTAQVVYAGGLTASAPLRSNRFVVLAATDHRLCAVRGLDAAGAVLAEQSLSAVAWGQGQGACP